MSNVSGPDVRWQVEQVFALAPRPSDAVVAQSLAVAARWGSTGCDRQGVWGRCRGTGSEPYDCVVDHLAVTFSCSCPSRRRPCKHVLALLLLWVHGAVPWAEGTRPGHAAAWLTRSAAADTTADAAATTATTARTTSAPPASARASTEASSTDSQPDSKPDAKPATKPATSTRDERLARMRAGLADLDRWLEDRVRTGLADPALASYRTWDHLAARLTDAQVGGLANRVRRTAGAVGAHPRWHEQVLAELGLLHLLASAGSNFAALSPARAESVAAAVGMLVRQADVLAGVPITDHWFVAGRSDVCEDRIEVRRTYLYGRATGEWAMVLSFAAYGQSLDTSLPVGSVVHADLFRYPGALGLRALVGRRHGDELHGDEQRVDEPVDSPAALLSAGTVAQACAEVGAAVAAEPWIERYPVALRAAPTRAKDGWVLTDSAGSLPLVADVTGGLAALLACSGGAAVAVTAEWTPAGLVPLAVHLADRTVDIGPTADPSFDAGRAEARA